MHGYPFWFNFILDHLVEITIGLTFVGLVSIVGIAIWLKRRVHFNLTKNE